MGFLKLNGYRLVVSEEEQIDMVQRAAATDITQDEWIEWVKRSVAWLENQASVQ